MTQGKVKQKGIRDDLRKVKQER